MSNVIQFPHPTSPILPIAHFIRLGESGYHKLASLQAAGRLPASRVVVDASRLKNQKDLVGALRAQGAEIVLDPKTAELSSWEKFAGHARHAPWAAVGDGRPLNPHHFDPGAPADIYGQIARFAVANGVHAVLAPSHFIGDPTFSGWLKVDRAACLKMRQALDREGGSEIAVDYLLITPQTLLSDSALHNEIGALRDLPFENLWVRASGFGSDATPLATRRFISSLSSLHSLDRPIVADYLGGLIGQAALAFGAISGLAHGIGERERFDARSWHRPPTKSESGPHGRAVRILIAGLDRTATVAELELMSNAKGGRRLVACSDRTCCASGVKDTIADPRQHAARQSFTMVGELAAIPDLKREEHFLNHQMSRADSRASKLKDLEFSKEDAARRGVDSERLRRRLKEYSMEVTRTRRSLEDLHEARAGSVPRVKSVGVRVPANKSSKAEKR